MSRSSNHSFGFAERIHQAQAAAAKAKKALQQKPKPPAKMVNQVCTDAFGIGKEIWASFNP